MNFMLPRVPLLSMCLVCAVAGAQETKPLIAGRVVRVDNGLPIEGVAVKFEPAAVFSSNGEFPTVITNENGEYRFHPDEDTARYIISASADGFVTQTYSRDGSSAGQVQHVDALTQLSGIDFHLKREAVIRGQLLGADEKPAGPGISVAAVRKEKRENGTDRMQPVMSAKTDANGRFTLAKLPPDTYFVCVNGPNGFNAFPDAEGWYHETWFGNADSVEGAIPLVLKEDDERDDLRIAVRRERRYRVIVWPSGPDDQPKPQRYDFRVLNLNHGTSGLSDGSYVIPGIPPGHYSLDSIAWSDSQYLGEGEMSFDVIDADVTLHLHVGGLGVLYGAVRSDKTPGNIPPGLMILIESERAAQAKDVDATGHFTFDRVLPGRYNFKLLKKPDGVVLHGMLRGVRCGGVAVTPDAPLVIGNREKVTDCEVLVGQSFP